MTKNYPLFDELNQTRHVCLHSQHACRFCVTKIHQKEDIEPHLQKTYLAPFEVVVHNKPRDLWVSIHGKVYDLTKLIQKHLGEDCIRPLIAFAGKDVSQWFDKKTGDIIHHIHPITGVRVPYCPHGPLPDVAPQVPSTDWRELTHKPWWADDQYFIGYLSKKVRNIRIQNMLSRQICGINVCIEDTLSRILERYLPFNADASSYTWYYEDRVLDMDKTLDENDIIDEREKFLDVGLPENTYIPMLLLYYNDDLKWEVKNEDDYFEC